MLKLSEIFYSLQGEGLSIGCPAVFIRTSGCNFKCGSSLDAKWKCDTWDIMTQTKLTLTSEQVVQEVAKIIPAHFLSTKGSGLHIVFTGGEPTLQLYDVCETAELLKGLLPKLQVEIETNGSNYINWPFNYINISPKLSSSGVSSALRSRPKVLADLLTGRADHVSLKIVVACEEDLVEIDQLIAAIESHIPISSPLRGRVAETIILMPAMETKLEGDAIRSLVWKWATERGWMMSLRAHIEVFDKKAGV